MTAIYAGQIKGMYIMGENPAMSDPDAHHAREALAKLEHLVVQDLFLTETAMAATSCCPPRPGRRRTARDHHQPPGADGRTALPLPGDARQDWWIVQEIARASASNWNYEHPRDVYAEMARAMPSLDTSPGSGWMRESSVTYPCDAPDAPGHDIVFGDRFPTDEMAAAGSRPPRSCLPRSSPTSCTQWC